MTVQPRIILTYGRFDMFNQHHVRFLRRISGIGHELIVGCTTDDLAVQSGLPCENSFEDRRAVLESCRFVSRVIAQTDPEQEHTDIVNYNISTLVLGEDQAGQVDDLQDVVQILYMPRVRPQGSHHLLGLFPKTTTRTNF
ncbi:MAG: glycerol-3-phosphate cytidylyltransferase [Sulfitobacter sp.]